MSVEVVVVPFAKDNFAYLLVAGAEAVVVDPGEAAPVLTALEARGLTLVAVWCTHHHGDHVGGIGALRAALGMFPVVGSAHDGERGRIPLLTRAVEDGDRLEGPGGSVFRALHVPGHTLGALAFVGEGHAFVGDTIFGAGCGRVFEGTFAQMARSLARIGALPVETRLWWGHAYTAANLRWARNLGERFGIALPEMTREAPSDPVADTGGTVGEERATNVFLRASAPQVATGPLGALSDLIERLACEDADASAVFIDAAGGYDAPAHAFALLRGAKDRG